MRRIAVIANLALFAAAAILVSAAQPSDTASIERYSLTYSGRAAGPGGRLGASGGLVVFDGGAGAVDGRLDSSPSAAARAASVAPGTLVATVAGQVNTEAGQQVVVVPTVAQAAHPGETKEDRAGAPAPQRTGPFVVGGVTASAQAGAARSEGTARFATARVEGSLPAGSVLAAQLEPLRRLYASSGTTSGTTDVDEPRDSDDNGAGTSSGAGTAPRDALDPAPAPAETSDEDAADEGGQDVLRVDGGTTQGTATADAAAGKLAVTATSTASEIVVAGQIVAEGVKGVARADLSDGAPTATTEFTVGSLTVAGVPVTVDERGVRAQDTTALSGEQVRSATKSVNAALEQAGVSIRLLRPVENVKDGSAQASSGGIEITLTTPSNEQVPGNEFAVVLGDVDVTLSTGEPVGAVSSITTGTGTFATGSTNARPVSSGPDVATSATSGGAPVQGGGGGAPPPVAADAGSSDGAQKTFAGFSGTQLLAGFAAWQLITLSIPTLASYAFQRRETGGAPA